MHLPDAPTPSLDAHIEAALPINDLQRDIGFIHAHLSGAIGEVDHLATSHSAVPAIQGQISEWLQQQFQIHTQTAQYDVICDVASRHDGWKEDAWIYNATCVINYYSHF